MKGNKTGGALERMGGREGKYVVHFYWRTLKGRYHLKDVVVDGRVILK
jgi:hypothetical protein